MKTPDSSSTKKKATGNLSLSRVSMNIESNQSELMQMEDIFPLKERKQEPPVA